MSTSSQTGKSSTADERLRLEFNDWAKAGKGPSMETGHRPVGEQAIASMNIPANARVLDVGCGSGWASRLMAQSASSGSVTGIDISDEMVRVAQESSVSFPNIQFQIASAEKLPFDDGEFTHAFSMESLYYYADILGALKEIRRVLAPGGLFVCVVDLYEESRPTHQWIDDLKVPVQLLSTAAYRKLFADAGFSNVRDSRIYDPRPVPDDYTGGSFATREDYLEYRRQGSLMISGEAA
ncbi:MAG TPA: class I SAM-dependent methyltransferase [Pyrinomonadaceae bacterium]|nr:class I SAM-dependent methyltransferase [Pyrinomonadaceae bacterium]